MILASVYDVKNLKLKMRPDVEHQYNSPWNIATDFTIDMSFSIVDIVDMLEDYKKDTRMEMDYLDAYHLTTRYMISFNFNKGKQTGVQKI